MERRKINKHEYKVYPGDEVKMKEVIILEMFPIKTIWFEESL